MFPYYDHYEAQYLDRMKQILIFGQPTDDRTGTGTKFLFGIDPIRIDLSDGLLPLLTTKKIHIRSLIHELMWFLSGSTNIKYLQENGVSIWDEWADENGDLGPVYGKQWRDFNGVDQIHRAMEQLKEKPNSRQNVISAWNPLDVPNMALPPCHTMFQLRAHEGLLHMHMYQRSADWFLGVPFNIASYALLNVIMAQYSGLNPGSLTLSYGDAHIYSNHFNQAREQLARRRPEIPDPLVDLKPRENLDELQFEDFVIAGYQPLPAIKAPIAV